MQRTLLVIVAGLVVLFGVILSSTVFTVHQAEQALVLQFGEPIRVIKEPGIQLKIPLIQDIQRMEKRILAYDAPQQEIIASDQKRLVVDAFARYRIVDPLEFYKSVGNLSVAVQRLDNFMDSSVREVLGRQDLQTIVSGHRAELMKEIQTRVNDSAKSLGLDIVDVRIKHADLPQANSEAIFRRMQTERDREAKEIRARGDELAQRIRADADRQVTVLLAEANRKSEILRGEGDAEKNRIFAEAFGADPDFFAFYRAMLAYRKAINNDDTTLVMSPDSEFFRYFESIGVRDIGNPARLTDTVKPAE
ncbi:protease modulator HflC [Oceanibacterium hippocampi]|uniref:Protein HflC n=1 Tax=Oceanibacterium hippocampi TaxID=745714 RepID=A0A1Y5TZF0_9PROT|nr:protease modulator HflC [Oceanibacterium hippocampi]SLN72447.1 Modulator of FtsH protease HflC [Oceanibacterium hippocampi]